MKNAVLLAGIPGTGKTTVAKALIERLGGFSSFKEYTPEQLVSCIKSDDLVIVGKYDDSDDVFQGTDKLSMAVSPNFQKYISDSKPERIFVEGDRLVGNKTIDFLIDMGYNVSVIVLEVSDETRVARYAERGSNQSDKFIKSKMTKVSNISSRLDLMMSDSLYITSNENEEDLDKILDTILDNLEIL